MLGFLLWNVNHKDRSDAIAQAVQENDAQVVALVEAPEDTTRLLTALQSMTGRTWRAVLATETKLVMVSCLSSNTLRGHLEDPIARSAAAVLTLYDGREVLLFLAHLPDKWTCPTADQLHHLELFSSDIKTIEAKRGHRRSIVLGDLNANPFDTGMITPRGLNAVATRDVASTGSRSVRDDPAQYPFFYNPMWSHLGDEDGRPRGTYFRTPARTTEVHWNVLDQVLLRPELLSSAPDPCVRVIHEIGGASLLTASGRPSTRYSDHLPVVCQLQVQVSVADAPV